ncbi:copper amine oxidase N-terminal domain-containing protein (plasmid) [Thermoanaerobacterium thermosaccharolyticum]|uniref:copper amine oxidase N-terminal domain-containing protein n=1 Tax=Thermoanaerobacterium thermosaccharolyticum TaxID=1517 RepID=UPI003DAA2D06
MLKKILAVILTLSLVFSAISLGFADDNTHTAIFVVGQSSYMQDNLSKSMDAATFIQNGRTYVPLRYLGLALGVDENDIQWDSASQTATLSMNGTTLKFTIGKTTYYANNQANSMDVAPIVKNGRVYLPARYVAEAFGYKVNWNGDTQAVTVYTDVTPQDPGNVWGFPLKATKAEIKAGSQYAQITDINGNTYNLDMGQKALAVIPLTIDFYGTTINYSKIWIDDFAKAYNMTPDDMCKVYPEGSYYITNKVDTPAMYVPFIPLAEAFGVPKENIQWDGQYLTIYGWDGSKDGYIKITANSTKTLIQWPTINGGDGSITDDYSLMFPMLVINGVPMVGIGQSEDNFSALLFRTDGCYFSMLRGELPLTAQAWSVEKGIVPITVNPF